jgi:MFS family permease
VRRLLRLVVVDIRPLRGSARFRWLFFGQFGAQLSRQLLVVAVPYEVFVRTHSTALVGLVGLVQAVPLVFLSLVGGVLADALDRRTVLMVTEALMSFTCVGFALNVSSSHVWPLFAIVAANAGLNGIESPARTAMVPSLVPRDQVVSAFAVNLSLNQTMQVVGPAVGGLLIAGAGIRASYLLAATGALLTAVAVIPLGVQDPVDGKGSVSVGAGVDGWRFLRKVPVLQQTMLLDLNAMVFGMPRALFPVIGTEILGGTARTVGLLYSAPGVGALIGALTTGWVSRVQRQGRAVIVAVGGWGIAIAAFGFSRNLPVCLALLALAGGADVVSNVFRNTILQTSTPDGLRGRVSALKGALSGAGPRLGDAEAGAVASLTTPSVSVVSGGLMSLFGAVAVVVFGRALWHFQAVTTNGPRVELVDPEPTET